MYYVIKQNGVVVGSGYCDANNFNAGFPAGFEWADPPAPAPVVKRNLTRLEYLSRFTDAEAIAIDLASQGATVEAATLRRMMAMVQAAEYISLDDARTIDGLNNLEAAGLLAAGRAAEILA